jgi:Protein of unknown function (DUF2975)
MKPPRLIHFLYQLFAVLYKLQLVVLILGLILFVTALSQLPRKADRWLHQLEGNRPRIRYDTLNPPIDRPPFNYNLERGNAQLGHTDIYYSQLPPDSVRVVVKQIIKYGSFDDDFTNVTPHKYSEAIDRTLSKTGFRLLIDSIQQANTKKLIDHRQYIVDSTLRLDPEARIVYGREGIYSITGGGFFTVNHTVLIPFQGYVYPADRDIWQWNRINRRLNTQYDSLGFPSQARLQIGDREPLHIAFTMTSWDDLRQVPWQAVLIYNGNLLLTAVLFFLITYQFRQLFKALTKSRYFSQEHPRRIEFIGWYFIGYTLLLFAVIRLNQWFAAWWLNQYEIGVNSAWNGVLSFPTEALPLLIGLLLLALAQIFRYGTQLQHEQDLTI